MIIIFTIALLVTLMIAAALYYVLGSSSPSSESVSSQSNSPTPVRKKGASMPSNWSTPTGKGQI